MSGYESLLDTVPGRLFIDEMRSSQGWGLPEILIRAATRAIGRYLYSDGSQEVAHFDANDPWLRQFDAIGLAGLARLSNFGSPQIHQGTITELREPRIGNRDPLSALPTVPSGRLLRSAMPKTPGPCVARTWAAKSPDGKFISR